MELWIRSQDKLKLLKCSMIFINYNNRNCISGTVGTALDGEVENDIPLAEYQTKERALEVLDEIVIFLVNANMIVYEMPEE